MMRPLSSSVFALGITLTLALACGDDPIEPPDPARPSLSATSLDFTAVEGASDPAEQTVAVTNTGGGTLSGLSASVSYTAGQPTGWLTASLGSTTAPATLTLAATTGSLAAGTYTATVSVSSSVADNSPQTVSVTFTVGAATTYTLATDVSPTSPYAGGTVTKSPDQGSYSAGAAVTLSATPSTGFHFGGWSGDVVSASNPVSIVVDENESVTANFLLKPPVLAQPSVDGQTIDLSWTYEWPCGTRCLVSSIDRYELEESTASSASGFVTAFQSGTTRQSPFTMQLTRSPGTYYYRVRARTAVGYSPYSAVRSVSVMAASRQVTIINNMSTSLNIHEVVQMKESATNTFGRADLLTDDPASCLALPGESIPAGGSRTFDITVGDNYYVFLGIGIWETDSFTCPQSAPWFKRRFFTDTNFNQWYVYAIVQVTGHSGSNWNWTISGSYLNGTLAVTPEGSGPIPFGISQSNPIP